MTERKLLAITIALVTCVSLLVCYVGKSDSNVQSKFGRFIVVEEGSIEDEPVYQYIMYDPDTMVMYSYLDGYKGGGFTVMYNADGTLKIYSPER